MTFDTNEIPQTFKTWIVNFKGINLPIGDLADDVSRDANFPEEDCFDEILEHIGSKSRHNPYVIETFVLAWGYYLASKDSSRPVFTPANS